MVKSNSLQPIHLTFEGCIVTQSQSIAYIFVNIFDESEIEIAKQKGETAKHMFEDTLEFNEVQIFENLTMHEVLKKLEYLTTKAEKFEMKTEH